MTGLAVVSPMCRSILTIRSTGVGNFLNGAAASFKLIALILLREYSTLMTTLAA